MLASRSSLAYLALGSNLGDRGAHLVAARHAISTIPGCSSLQASALYETAAWGSVTPQPDYLNAVVAIETTISPQRLWEYVQGIELMHGRVRSAEQNAARTLDIDLLLFGDAVMNTATLVLPHPRMHLRKFVLIPLLEIAPAISIPGLGRASDLLTHLFESDPRKVHSIPAWK